MDGFFCRDLARNDVGKEVVTFAHGYLPQSCVLWLKSQCGCSPSRASSAVSTTTPHSVMPLRRRGGGQRRLLTGIRRQNVDQQKHRRLVAVVADLGSLEWPDVHCVSRVEGR